MLDHVILAVSDIARSVDFYTAILARWASRSAPITPETTARQAIPT